ncbi:hypothetical protein FQR65_LT19871 [Abscondita terminalis]|nr:hypothetical protein FQR65_LT19871 [Abscondita terminalis]
MSAWKVSLPPPRRSTGERVFLAPLRVRNGVHRGVSSESRKQVVVHGCEIRGCTVGVTTKLNWTRSSLETRASSIPVLLVRVWLSELLGSGSTGQQFMVAASRMEFAQENAFGPREKDAMSLLAREVV